MPKRVTTGKTTQTKATRTKATSGKARSRRGATAKSADGPWKHDNPKGDGEHRHLSPQAKASAKRSAAAAGRPYPNLIDNMRAAKSQKK